MKIKALVNCIGLGYDLKEGDVAELDNELAKKLIKFKYVEEVKTRETRTKK